MALLKVTNKPAAKRVGAIVIVGAGREIAGILSERDVICALSRILEITQALPSCNGQLRKSDLSRLAQSIANDGITLACHLIGGDKKIRSLEIAIVDLFGIDILRQINRALALEFDGVNFFRLQQDVSVAVRSCVPKNPQRFGLAIDDDLFQLQRIVHFGFGTARRLRKVCTAHTDRGL
jgi:hypothetical protein